MFFKNDYIKWMDRNFQIYYGIVKESNLEYMRVKWHDQENLSLHSQGHFVISLVTNPKEIHKAKLLLGKNHV